MTAATLPLPSRLLAQLSEGLPRPFWALLAGTFVTKAGAFVVPFLFIYLTRVRQLDPLTAGSVVSLFGLGSFLGSLAGGVLADRLGRRATMLGALVVGAGFLLVLGAATALWLLALATFLTGLTGDAYRPASQALVADLVEPKHRMKAFGLQYWAINLGFSFAAAVGGLLATNHFSALFFGDAATTLALAFIIWRAVPETRPTAPGRAGARQEGSALTPFFDARFAPFLGLTFVIALLFFQHLTALPSDMATRGLGTETLGWALSVNGLLIVLLQPLATRWAVRLSREQVLALAAVLTGVGFGLTSLATTLGGYAATVAVWTLGEILFAPVNAAVVADLSPEHLRGRYQGAFTITWALAHMSAPIFGTALLPWLGSAAFWAGCGALGLGVAAVFGLFGARFVPKGAESR